MPLILQKELKTKSGTFSLAINQTGDCALGFEAENSVDTSYVFIAKPLALLIGELFDFMKAQQQE